MQYRIGLAGLGSGRVKKHVSKLNKNGSFPSKNCQPVNSLLPMPTNLNIACLRLLNVLICAGISFIGTFNSRSRELGGKLFQTPQEATAGKNAWRYPFLQQQE
jgi:hypothetical protein